MIKKDLEGEGPRPLLTIAIPTYNRACFLKELLSSLIEQLATEPRVELIVSDNASSDETADVVQAFRRQGLRIRYLRNQENLGADGNILQCFEQARGKYVWIIGDDDIVLEGALKQIMLYLKDNDYDLIYLSAYGFRQNPISEYKPDPSGRSDAIAFTEARIFTRQIGTMFTLISCNIINKEKLATIEHPPFSKFSGTSFIQLGWVYPLLANFHKGLFVFHRFLAIRDGTSGGYSISRVFGQSLKSITEELLSCRPELTRLIYRSAVQGILPLAILRVRQERHGDFALEDFHALLQPIYGNSYRYWLFVFPIIKLPLWLATTWFAGMRSGARLKGAICSSQVA